MQQARLYCSIIVNKQVNKQSRQVAPYLLEIIQCLYALDKRACLSHRRSVEIAKSQYKSFLHKNPT